MKKKRFSRVLASLLASLLGLAAPPEAHGRETELTARQTPAPDLEVIKKCVQRYRKAKAVGMNVEKSVAIELLQSEKKSQGRLFFSKGRLRLEIEKPEKSLLVADGKFIWVVTELGAELGGKTQVAKIKAEKSRSKSNALLALLFEDEKVWDDFELKKESEADGVKSLELEPKANANLAEITKVALKVHPKKKEIREIVYWDELDNKTSYVFSKVDFKAAVPSSRFTYRPPKGADITEY